MSGAKRSGGAAIRGLRAAKLSRYNLTSAIQVRDGTRAVPLDSGKDRLEMKHFALVLNVDGSAVVLSPRACIHSGAREILSWHANAAAAYAERDRLGLIGPVHAPSPREVHS